jgi:hypothetical protein
MYSVVYAFAKELGALTWCPIPASGAHHSSLSCCLSYTQNRYQLDSGGKSPLSLRRYGWTWTFLQIVWYMCSAIVNSGNWVENLQGETQKECSFKLNFQQRKQTWLELAKSMS